MGPANDERTKFLLGVAVLKSIGAQKERQITFN